MKLTAIWSLFKKGEAVSQPGAWKNATIVANFLTAIVVFLAEFDIVDIRPLIDAQALEEIAIGGVAVANIIVHIITSKTVGLPNKAKGGD